MQRTTGRHRHSIGVTRREVLQAGYSALMGLSAPALLARRARATTGAPRKPARAVLLVFLTGGPSHHDTFDPKPNAPTEIRGEFGALPTRVDGIQICEHLPELARRMDRLALIRSMAHLNPGHLPATHWVLTGHPMPGLPLNSGADKIRSRTDWPSYGAAVSYFRPRTDGVPGAVNLPTYLQEGPLLWPGQYAGCLGPAFDPWQIRDDPSKPDFRVENLSLPAGFALERLQARQTLLSRVNAAQSRLEALAESRTLDDHQRAAFHMLTSGRFGQAFRLEQEAPATRERYGRHLFGQSLLLARRLVEAGVPVVQANMGIVQTWDTHTSNWRRLREQLLPPLDRGVSALLDDLRERGLEDEVLVVITGEFGRTPKISTLGDDPNPGRDHWPDVFSCALSGAGVRGGQVIGASDAQGAYPDSQAYTPDDLGATLYHVLGIDPGAEFVDREGRPLRLSQGEVIRPLFTGSGS
jgi:hypothetical protein